MNNATLPIHRFREDHMATFFEVQIAHEDKDYARQAAQAGFQTTARLEGLLSRYRENSEVSQISRLSPNETSRLHLDTFACLQIASEMHQLTGGAFDPALGAQMDRQREGKSEKTIDHDSTKRGRLIMNPENFTVTCMQAHVNLDLGAIGKGFALDRMAEDLRDWEIDRALLIAGRSSILALHGPDSNLNQGWEVHLSGSHKLLLSHGALGTSGTSVKGAHILDPRTGTPAQGPYRTWATAKSAAVCDALSTAWMLLGLEEIKEVCQQRSGIGAIIQTTADAPEDLIQISFDHFVSSQT